MRRREYLCLLPTHVAFNSRGFLLCHISVDYERSVLALHGEVSLQIRRPNLLVKCIDSQHVLRAA